MRPSPPRLGSPKLGATQKRLRDRNNGRHPYQRRGREMREDGAIVRLIPFGTDHSP